MEEYSVDNPVSFLLQLVIRLRPESLNGNRENFIMKAVDLSRHEAGKLWHNQLFNSWGEACTTQALAQIFQQDIMTISKDAFTSILRNSIISWTFDNFAP